MEPAIIYVTLFWFSEEYSYVKMECMLFVCFEVLRPSQHTEVMSSVVNLPNYTFTGQV